MEKCHDSEVSAEDTIPFATQLFVLAQVVWDLGFPGGSVVKNLSAKQETGVRFLGWEDPLEKEMATHSTILAWKTPWMEQPERLQSVGSQRVRHDLVTKQQQSYQGQQQQ